MSLAVNVSAKQFENENSMRDIFAILDETGLDPRYLEFGADRKCTHEACRIDGDNPVNPKGKGNTGGCR
jgi:predicted signal transduction protein with EAL and GGDEF domain